jgi:hypothetical protein
MTRSATKNEAWNIKDKHLNRPIIVGHSVGGFFGTLAGGERAHDRNTPI